ncbi:RNA polymerase sigma factor [Streptomyces sp. NPDC087422]|uniref:RNA polymerase sigma factor n=1 Tax=Streptomyces sp. NPDC087422 TaxID=3365786 RepID=UPI0038134961
MLDVTPAQRTRLTHLFEAHHERLVRVLRARLGRYDWHQADDVAALTWLYAAEQVDAFDGADEFGWLSRLAWTAVINHRRLARSARELAPTAVRTRAYPTPTMPTADDVTLIRCGVFARLAVAATEAVAA